MRFVTIVGTRPQFVKAAALSRRLRARHEEILVHTGQHYDDNMSAVFFRELDLPPVDRHLGVGPGAQGAQTAAMLQRIEEVLQELRPDAVIVFGDTNSTLAGALAATKLQFPIAHVEAGMRSFARDMPEEINRVMTDHVSRWLFAPCAGAAKNLAAEGIREGVFVVGDIMADCLRHYGPLAEQRSQVLNRLGLGKGEYAVATIHRRRNLDSPERLASLLSALGRLPLTVVLPLHPHTAGVVRKYGLAIPQHADSGRANGLRHGHGLFAVEPQGYFDMIHLQRHARVVLTDSGGMQKEAYYLEVPCITLREETEWTETVEAGWNRLVGADERAIVRAVRECLQSRPAAHPDLYGDGCAGQRIVEILSRGPADEGADPA